MTEEKLNEAIATVVNGYSQCELTKVWGLGKSASGAGTKWDLSPQNLMSEYHIRYGGYGGIGYYLVSDLYIALFSRFTTCGSWEGHHILDSCRRMRRRSNRTLSTPIHKGRVRLFLA